MVSTVYVTNKKTGVTHAYTSESYRDPVTKKPRTHRTYLGRVDPVTGAIIPKGPPGSRNRSKLSAPDNERTLPPEIKQLISDQTDAITRMKAEMDKAEARNRELLQLVKKLNDVTSKMVEVLGNSE